MPKDTTASNVLQMHVTRAHMQIGHDAVHMLNGFGRVRDQSAYGLWNSLVQTGRDGAVSKGVRLDALINGGRTVGTYGTFLKSYVFPAADKLTAQLEALSEKQRTSRLAFLVVDAVRDSRTHWVLSANPVRRFLYPGAYDADSTRRHRIDRLFYVPHTEMFSGSFIAPRSLDRADIDHWKNQVSEEFPSYDVDRFSTIVA